MISLRILPSFLEVSRLMLTKVRDSEVSLSLIATLAAVFRLRNLLGLTLVTASKCFCPMKISISQVLYLAFKIMENV